MLALTSPELYETQIDLLYQKRHSFSRGDGNDISIQTLNLHQEQVARLLAQQMKHKTYTPHPVRERVIHVDKKERLICKLNVFDHLIQSALCKLIMPRLHNYLSTHIYSYQGRSNYLAAQHFSQFIKTKIQNDKLDLFVIRTDVKSYTDTIPVDDAAPLWKKLTDLLNHLQIDDNYQLFLFQLIKQFLRPIIISDNQNSYHRLIGLPMGSPLSAIIALIYLNELDFNLSKQPQTFYARYGDDILIAHHDISTIKSLNQALINNLNTLGLHTNQKKHQLVYLTRCGRRFTEDRSLLHAQKITYLGFDILAKGNIALKPESERIFLKDIMQRITNLFRLYRSMEQEQQGRLICQTLNQSFIPTQPLANEKILLLLKLITSREQLRHLDYLIARKIAEESSGLFGVRAFRSIPYKKIRRDWGLHSLCTLRNHGLAKWTPSTAG